MKIRPCLKKLSQMQSLKKTQIKGIWGYHPVLVKLNIIPSREEYPFLLAKAAARDHLFSSGQGTAQVCLPQTTHPV